MIGVLCGVVIELLVIALAVDGVTKQLKRIADNLEKSQK